MKKVGVALAFAAMATIFCSCMLIEKPITSRMSTTEPVSRPYALQPRTVMVDDITINYMEAGDGPNVILLHGGIIPYSLVKAYLNQPIYPLMINTGALATADSWNYNITALARNFHVVAIDLPGFGGSDKPDIDYSLEDYKIYLDAFMDVMDMDEAMLVGHGFGGQIAISYAMENPERVDRLVLVNSYGAWGARYPFLARSIKNKPVRFVSKFWQREKAAKAKTIYPLNKKMFRNWRKPTEWAVESMVSTEVVNAYPKNIIVSKEGASGKFLDSIVDYKMKYITTDEYRKEVDATYKALLYTQAKELQGSFKDLDKPVLIAHGTHDPVVELDEARYMEKMFPRATLILYEESGHYPMVEEADRFNQDVTFFLSGKDIAKAGN